MYSQYNYYQNYNIPQSSAPQNVVATTTAGMHWNGTHWVSSAPAAPSFSAYAAPTGNITSTGAETSSKSHAELVHQFTHYFHYWNAQAEEARLLFAKLPLGPDKSEAERREKWASYYSTSSAALAHYHLSLSQGGPEPYQKPQTPPPPPQLAATVSLGENAQAAVPSNAPSPAKKDPSNLNNNVTAGVAEVGQSATNETPVKTNGAKHKKSRWGSLMDHEEKKSERDNGKSEAVVCGDNMKGGSSKTLYLNKFVQAKANPELDSFDDQHLAKPGSVGVCDSPNARPNSVDRKHGAYSKGESVVSTNGISECAEKINEVSTSQGTKRKIIDSYASPTPTHDSYYGPSSVGGRNEETNENFISLSPRKLAARKDKNKAKKHKMKATPDSPATLNGFSFENHERTSLRQRSIDLEQNDEDFERVSSKAIYESSLSANDSYYGPSSRDCVNDAREEDFVSLLPSKSSAKTEKIMAKKNKSKATIDKSISTTKGVGFEHHERTLAKRANRFKGRGGIGDVSNVKSTIENFEKYMGKTVIGGMSRQLDEEDFERMTVKGTCQVLEKDYLRLTSPPRAELVRPQSVLEKHLMNLKKSWKKRHRQGGAKRDYNWYCSQLKAIRQDLTVQRIFNAFSVDVYETHAKIALEEDDINEFNQSQTQLKELYESMLGREDKPENKGALKNMNEFISYRIIYYLFLAGNKKYEGGSSDIFKIMLKLSPEQKKDPFIHHALLVRAAVADNDYHKFFQLQDAAPRMIPLLMEKIVPTVRHWALQRICKAYRPSVSADFVLKELGFDPAAGHDFKFGKEWLVSCGCKLGVDGDADVLLTKESVLTESALKVKSSLI